MPRNFDELLSNEKTFVVRGETFTFTDVRPEVLTSLGQIDENGDPNAVWKAQDDQIMKFLVPEDHERWKNLRERNENPITMAQFNAILEYLVESQTDRPTQTPSPSASGRGRTAATSKAA
jgi:hypothetical protein